MQIIGLSHIPLIQTGDDLSDIILTAAQAIDLTLAEGDIIVVAQKIISKAEDQWVNLATVTPSDQALELAAITGKPAALIEVILWDTATVIRAVPGLLIVEHKLGFISANAGIDHSNVSAQPDFVLRLPADPDASARALRSGINARTGVNPPLVHAYDALRTLNRYTYIFNGGSQVLDHILMTPALASHLAEVRPLRINADFAYPAAINPTESWSARGWRTSQRRCSAACRPRVP